MKTYTLKIFNADGSLYWKEHFNDENSMNKWLEEEKTRPYWKEEYTSSFEIIEEPEVDMAEVMAEIEAKRKSAKAKLKALGLTDDEIIAIIGL